MTEVWDDWFSDYPNLVSADIRGAISNPNFSSCPKLKTITTGKGFEGYNCTSSDMYSSSHFPQGFWKNAKNGELYNHQEIPTSMEATWEYYAKEPSADIWVNAGTAKWGCFDGNLTVKPQIARQLETSPFHTTPTLLGETSPRKSKPLSFLGMSLWGALTHFSTTAPDWSMSISAAWTFPRQQTRAACSTVVKV